MKLLDEEVLLKYWALSPKEPITRQELEDVEPDVVKLVPDGGSAPVPDHRGRAPRRKLIVATTDPLNVVALDDLRRATAWRWTSNRLRVAIQEAILQGYRR